MESCRLRSEHNSLFYPIFSNQKYLENVPKLFTLINIDLVNEKLWIWSNQISPTYLNKFSKEISSLAY